MAVDQAVSGQCGGDDVEGGGAFEPCGVDGGSDVGFGLCSPHGAIAIGDFTLDHARAEFALGAVVGGVDFAGIVTEGEKLMSGAGDLGLEFLGEGAAGLDAQQLGEPLFQLALLGGDGGVGAIGDRSGEVEGAVEPELEP